MAERVFSFDIGWAFHGWGVLQPEGIIDTGVYGYEHDFSYQEYSEIRRDKKRKKSKRDRLKKLKKKLVSMNLFNSEKN